jgi:ATP-dependent helicase HrpA
VTFAAVDEAGAVVRTSKDLRALQAGLAPRVRSSVAAATVLPHSDLEREGLTTWDLDALPETIETRVGETTVRAFPALADRGDDVAIVLETTPEAQRRVHRSGVRRLLLLATPSPTGYVQDHLTSAEKLALAASPYPSTRALFADALVACVDDAVPELAEIRTRAAFEAARDRVGAGLVDALFATVSSVSTILATLRDADRAITAASSLALMAPLADARAQAERLVHPGFVSATGIARLPRIPVYLRGIVSRVARMQDNPGRDRQWMNEVEEATRRYVSAGGELPLDPDAPERLRHARWMLEELRLSLFAQELRTAEPVSLQRITRVLEGR